MGRAKSAGNSAADHSLTRKHKRQNQQSDWAADLKRAEKADQRSELKQLRREHRLADAAEANQRCKAYIKHVKVRS